MGSGKTMGMINYMNSEKDKRFIFITPYLTEVERVKVYCGQRRFKEPLEVGSKLQALKLLVKGGFNIVTTHALFKSFDLEVIQLIKEKHYVLVMDESLDLIETEHVGVGDIEILKDYFLTEVSEGEFKWQPKNPDYNGVFNCYKNVIGNSSVRLYNAAALVKFFPIEWFTAFDEIFAMTYMFDSQLQKKYFDFYKAEYEYWEVVNERNNFVLRPAGSQPIKPESRKQYKKLITIVDTKKINLIGEDRGALCYGWYLKNNNTLQTTKLKKHLKNFYKNLTKTHVEQRLWTSFKCSQEALSDKGFQNSFVPYNVRATNDYREATAIAYLVNKFYNPCTKNQLSRLGIKIDEKQYALSELLQFLWRSALRDGKPITLYIPSKRMRTLLTDWLNDVDLKTNEPDDEVPDEDLEVPKEEGATNS